MTQEPRDGGPAFPYSVQRLQSSYSVDVKGMSLRDWFAGMAMQGLTACPNYVPKCVGDETIGEAIARNCYGFADAILAARKGGNDKP